MAAVLAIYARENGAGTMFEPEAAYEADGMLEGIKGETVPSESLMSVIDGDRVDEDGQPDDEPPQPPRGGRPALRVVK
ncbi:Stringent starvation protein B [compost metagenome]